MTMNLNNFRPMLAATTDDYDWDKLKYPVWVSPKLDGIRCFVHPELGPVSRTLKPIPNEFIRKHIASAKWLDGELVVGSWTDPKVFNTSQSGVMSHGGCPDFTFYVFDHVATGNMCGFGIRLEDVDQTVRKWQLDNYSLRIVSLGHRLINNYEELVQAEEHYLEMGFEGLMIRSPGGKYKFGRSTQVQQGLMKMKRFVDDEAIIVGWEPLLRNQNDPIVDALGLQKRGYSKDGKVIDDARVGKFIAEGVPGSRWAGVRFGCGSGLDDADRLAFRQDLDNMMGKHFSYKYQSHGSIDAPRSPIWKGLRYDHL